jgi:hypothetical protein
VYETLKGYVPKKPDGTVSWYNTLAIGAIAGTAGQTGNFFPLSLSLSLFFDVIKHKRQTLSLFHMNFIDTRTPLCVRVFVVAYPLDLVRRKLQVQGFAGTFDKTSHYNGMIDAFKG